MKTIEQWENGFYGTHKQHDLLIERDHPSSDWYIVVRDQTGMAAYDGWWRDSKHKPVKEAISEAIRGAAIS